MGPSQGLPYDFGEERLEGTSAAAERDGSEDDLETGLMQLLSGSFDPEATVETSDGPPVLGARSFEFACRGCFLILHRWRPILCRTCAASARKPLLSGGRPEALPRLLGGDDGHDGRRRLRGAARPFEGCEDFGVIGRLGNEGVCTLLDRSPDGATIHIE